jgi:hypothetical protein
MSRSRPPQCPQHNTSTSNALAMSWAHVQFQRGEHRSATGGLDASVAGQTLAVGGRSATAR